MNLSLKSYVDGDILGLGNDALSAEYQGKVREVLEASQAE